MADHPYWRGWVVCPGCRRMMNPVMRKADAWHMRWCVVAELFERDRGFLP